MSTRHSARAAKPSTKLLEATEPSPPVPSAEPASKRRKVAAALPAAKGKAAKGKGRGKGKANGAKTEEVEPEEEEEEEEEEEDPDRLYCICRQKDDGRPMVMCEECKEWYHYKCIKKTKAEVEQLHAFYCPACVEKSGNKLKSIRTYDISLLPSPPRSTKALPKGKDEVEKNGKAPKSKAGKGAGKAAAAEGASSGKGKGKGKAGAKAKAAAAAVLPVDAEEDPSSAASSSASSDSEDDKADEFTLEREVAAGRSSGRMRQKARDAPVESESDSDREASARDGSSRRSVSTAPATKGGATKRRKSSTGPQQPAKRARQSSIKDEAKSQEKTAAFRNWGRGKLGEGLEPAFVAYHAHRAEVQRETAEQEPVQVEDDAVIASTERFLSEAEARAAAVRYADAAEDALFERTKEKSLDGTMVASQAYKRAIQVFQEAFKALRKDLAEGIVTGSIPPEKFALMTGADLASEEQMAERKRLEEASMKSLVRSDDPRQQIRYTKKGLEDAETLQSIHRNIHEAERRVSDAGSTKVEDAPAPTQAADTPGLDRKQSVTSASGPPATPVQEDTDFFKSPSRDVLPSVTPETPPVRPAPRQSSFSLSSVLGKQSGMQYMPVEAVDEEDGAALPGFTDDNDNTNEPEDGFDAYLSQQERANAAAREPTPPAGPTPEEELLAMPVIWRGKINNPADETAGQALVEARQVGGADINPQDPIWRALIPTDSLNLIGRVPVPDSAKYLMNCRLSASKELVIVAFLPARGEPEGDAVKPYESIAAFHVDRKRHGVITPHGSAPVPPGAAKELYLVPLERGESFEFLEIMDQLSLPVGLEKTVLLGVFIVNKPKDEPPAMRPPPPSTAQNGGAPYVSALSGMPLRPPPTADLSSLLASLNPEALKAATAGGMPPPPPSMPPYAPFSHPMPSNGAPYPYRPTGNFGPRPGPGPGMGGLPPHSPTPPVPTPNAARPPAVHPSRLPFVAGATGGQMYGPGPGLGQMYDDRRDRQPDSRSPQMNGGRGPRGPWER